MSDVHLVSPNMAVGLNRPVESQDSRRSAQLYKKRVVARSVETIKREHVVAGETQSAVQRINSNPVANKTDLTRLLCDLLSPLEACQSTGGARVKLGHSGAGYDPVAAELEGYARALWGLGPLMASEPDHPSFRIMRTKWVHGLINGTDPDHPEYWGDCRDRDQRMVEQAAIVSHCVTVINVGSFSDSSQSVSIAIAPEVFWRPLSTIQRARVNSWLLQGNDLIYPASNWRCKQIVLQSGYINGC